MFIIKRNVLRSLLTEYIKFLLFTGIACFITFILSYTPVLGLINNIFYPLVKLFGLPKGAVLPVLFALSGNSYMALGSAFIFTFTTKQWILLSLFISLTHSIVYLNIKSKLKKTIKKRLLFLALCLVATLITIHIWKAVLPKLNYTKKIGISSQIVGLKGGGNILKKALSLYVDTVMSISIYFLPVLLALSTLKDSTFMLKKSRKFSRLFVLINKSFNNSHPHFPSSLVLNDLSTSQYLLTFFSRNLWIDIALFFPYIKWFAFLIPLTKLIIVFIVTFVGKIAYKKRKFKSTHI